MAGDLALTFDDGPGTWTGPILDLLARHDARATFFILGPSVAGNESLLERALTEGHELGVHGWSHRRLTELGEDEIVEEMAAAAVELKRAVGVEARYWRPPYFDADERVRAALAGAGLIEAACTVAPQDYRWPADRTASFVIERLERHAIVDLHDGRPPRSRSDPGREQTVYALDLILAAMAERGFRSATLSALPPTALAEALEKSAGT